MRNIFVDEGIRDLARIAWVGTAGYECYMPSGGHPGNKRHAFCIGNIKEITISTYLKKPRDFIEVRIVDTRDDYTLMHYRVFNADTVDITIPQPLGDVCQLILSSSPQTDEAISYVVSNVPMFGAN